MRCPFCGIEDTQVKDSRSSEDGTAIRRRRECVRCGSRFTTFERVVIREIMVIKKDGSKKSFDRDKLVRSINLAVRKRPITNEQVEQVVNNITRKFETSGEAEITTKQIGEAVMDVLYYLDQVAYVRFASVYKDFAETKDFKEFIGNIKNKEINNN